jgi:hypothetical protein
MQDCPKENTKKRKRREEILFVLFVTSNKIHIYNNG